jgi:hypothetical protein
MADALYLVRTSAIGGFILNFKTDGTIPESLIALDPASVGALAGLLAPSSMTR